MSRSDYHQLAGSSLQAASERRFPAFLGPVSESTPINATPYLCQWQELLTGQLLPGQSRHVRSLGELTSELGALGVSAQVILIGGSALSANDEARDLDAVMFYLGDQAIDWESVRARLGAAHIQGLDVRLVPVDVDPVVLLKNALFFGALYASNDRVRAGQRGQLLVDCRERV